MACILIVEDHHPTLCRLSDVLRRWRFEVLTASNLTEALQIVESSALDLIISDIDLPDGSGWDLAQQVARGRRIPAITMSTFFTEEELHLGSRLGISAHLPKPLMANPLRQAIGAALGALAQTA